jgi:drug/metabolite transporter (DMT)-like permease
MGRAKQVILAISSGAGPALLAAALFGASTPLAKLLLRGIDPWMLAGVLYLGSGIGLGVLRIFTAAGNLRGGEIGVRGGDWPWLGSAIIAGGVVAPVLLMMGLASSAASTAALLLNLEGVFTVVLARFVFREHVDRRIAAGMASIVAGGVVLAAGGRVAAGEWLGPAAIAAACLMWAVDNNLTRRVSATDPVFIATLKGGVAGATNVAIARWLGSAWPASGMLATAGLVGFLGYGISLVLFVVALRGIGVARTAAYFSLAPFFGGVIAVLVLRDAVTVSLVAAGILMAAGIWLHLTERHEHEHEHEEPPQEARDIPGGKHPHGPATEPSPHGRGRSPVRHSHPHYPDSDHRHGH